MYAEATIVEAKKLVTDVQTRLRGALGDAGYEWLGYPTPCQLSYTEWRHCVAPVPLDPKRKGHALDVAIAAFR